MKIKLNKRLYALIKKIEFFEYSEYVFFNDNDLEIVFPDIVNVKYKNGEAEESGIEVLGGIITDNIVMYGMDEKQNQCTEYGRDLYSLHDWLMYSDYWKEA